MVSYLIPFCLIGLGFFILDYIENHSFLNIFLATIPFSIGMLLYSELAPELKSIKVSNHSVLILWRPRGEKNFLKHKKLHFKKSEIIGVESSAEDNSIYIETTHKTFSINCNFLHEVNGKRFIPVSAFNIENTIVDTLNVQSRVDMSKVDLLDMHIRDLDFKKLFKW